MEKGSQGKGLSVPSQNTRLETRRMVHIQWVCFHRKIKAQIRTAGFAEIQLPDGELENNYYRSID